MSTVLIPIVLAGLYGVVMFQFSAWSLKKQLSRQSNPLIDKNLEKIMAKFANVLEVEKIRLNIFETEPINGLAAPDGRIFITRGFYKKYQNGDITVEEIFTHRKNIYSIDSSLKTSDIFNKINNSRYTRIPFWKDNPENIIGLLLSLIHISEPTRPY